ncbi:hypothetical protein DID88_006151 [Monilinia fructigena]|uniref:Peroxisomal membrane protein 4 n=1 Tax=Monilinia fructigena TaxID=38457 RepID=A0A395J288_9HELO|nr:hypothetical protein DID88_006151 [Monilinia fructigena]
MRDIEVVKTALEHFILDPKNAEYLAVLKAARSGAVYGAKVRFPHALVMMLLFRSVFGRRSKKGHVSSVSKQIVIFVFARVCLSLAQLAVEPSAGLIRNKKLSDRISKDAWPVFAALSWGSVMWLFSYDSKYNGWDIASSIMDF